MTVERKSEAVVDEEPLFRSFKEALSFALNYSHGQTKPPGLASMVAGPRKKGRGLGGLDGAAQAGLIQAELTRLTEVRQKVMRARYSVRTLPCSCRNLCCSGSAPNPDWLTSVQWLVEDQGLRSVCPTVSHYRLRRGLVMRYFGYHVVLGQLAKDCAVHRNTVTAHADAIGGYLHDQERLASFEIEGVLKEAGLIE